MCYDRKSKLGAGSPAWSQGLVLGKGFQRSRVYMYPNRTFSRTAHSVEPAHFIDTPDTVPEERAQGWSSVEDDTLIACHSRKWVALAVPIWYLKPGRFQESCGSSAHLGS